MVARLSSAGKEIALVINMSPEQLDVKLVTLEGSSYGRYQAVSNRPVEVLVLPPFEVEVLKLIG